jgi:hypothetical protein
MQECAALCWSRIFFSRSTRVEHRAAALRRFVFWYMIVQERSGSVARDPSLSGLLRQGSRMYAGEQFLAKALSLLQPFEQLVYSSSGQCRRDLGSREAAAWSAAVLNIVTYTFAQGKLQLYRVLNTVISVTRSGGVFVHTVGLIIMQWWWHVMCSVVFDWWCQRTEAKAEEGAGRGRGACAVEVSQ